MTITSQTGGALAATMDGAALSGQYTEVYGDNHNQVTVFFSFTAKLDGQF